MTKPHPQPSINSDITKALDLIQAAYKAPFNDVDANFDKLNQTEQLLKKVSDELGIDEEDDE